MRIFLAAGEAYKHIAWSLQKGLSMEGHQVFLYFTNETTSPMLESAEILLLVAPAIAFATSYQPQNKIRRLIETAFTRKLPIIPLVFFNNRFESPPYKRFVHESIQAIMQIEPLSLNFTDWDATVDAIKQRLENTVPSSGYFQASELAAIDETALRNGRKAEEAYERGNQYYFAGDLQNARAAYDEAIALLPDYAVAYNNRALIRRSSGDLEGAIADISEAIRLNPSDGIYYSNRSMFDYDLDKYQAAVDDATKAIELNPETATAYNNRAIAFVELGEKEKALEDYNKAIELENNVSMSWLNRARLQADLGMNEAAINDYSRVIELNSSNGDAYHGRARLYVKRKETEAALADFEKAIGLTKSERSLAELYHDRAALYSGLRDFDNAAKDIKAGLALRPSLDREQGLQYLQDMMALAQKDDRYKTRIDPIIAGIDELYDSVGKHLKPKFDAEGFTISRYNYTSGAGSVIGFSSEAYWFLIVYEKGQVYASLGSAARPPDNDLYFDLWYVFEFLKHDFLRNYAGTIEEQVRHIAHNLLKYWDEIFTDDLLIRREPELKRFIDEGQRKIWGNR